MSRNSGRSLIDAVPANIGAAVTKFVAPFVLVAYGWQVTAQVWAIGLAVMVVVFWFTTTDDPVLRERLARGEKPTSAGLNSSC